MASGRRVARADGGADDGLVAEVRRAFRLESAVPADFEQPRFGRVDQRAVTAGKEALGRAKLAWEKLARGSTADLAVYAQAIAALRAAMSGLPFGGLRAVAEAFAEAGRVLALGQPVPSEALALETASALLFTDQLFDRALKDADVHDARAFEMAERLTATLAGTAPDEEVPDWLRELASAAQERLTMATFIGEAQGNLRSIEQALDSFFRDPAQRADLPQTVRQLYQVSGALHLLGHQDAASAANVVAEQVQRFVSDEAAPSAEACEAVAGSLGALGFFVEGLQQQPGRSGTRFAFNADSGRFSAELAEPARAAQAPVVVALSRRGGEPGPADVNGVAPDVSPGRAADAPDKAGAQGAAGSMAAPSSANASLEQPYEPSTQSLGVEPARGAQAGDDVASEVPIGAASLPLTDAPSIDLSMGDASLPAAHAAEQPPAVTVEARLAEHTQQASDLFDALAAAPADAGLRDALRHALTRMRDDALLADDARMKDHAVAALALLDTHEGSSLAGAAGAMESAATLRNPLADLPGVRSAVPAAPAPAEPPRDEASIDSELLEIFLGEAQEVLEAIAQAAQESRAAPSDQAFLTTIRRGFHTLKGSSRMVGLTEFGEAGWAMEQVLNLWLAEERSGTPPLYELIDLAGERFGQWVQALQAGDMRPVDAAAMIAAAAALREGQPHEAAFAALAGTAPVMAVEALSADAGNSDEIGDVIEMSLPEESGFEVVDVAGGIEVVESLDAADGGEVIEAEAIEAEAIEAGSIETGSIEVESIEAESIDIEPVALEPIDVETLLVVEPIEAIESVEIVEPIEAVEPIDSVESLDVQPLDVAESLDADEPLDGQAAHPPAAKDFSAVIEAIEMEASAEPSEAIDLVSLTSIDTTPIDAGGIIAANDDASAALVGMPDPFDLSAPIETASSLEVGEAAAEPADEIQIGERTLSRSLYEIFLSEADELVTLLSEDSLDWRTSPMRAASEAAQRAMHSLKGSAALVALDGVRALAEQLETFLLRQRVVGRPMTLDDLSDYAAVIERMRAMLHQFAAGAEPRSEHEASAIAHALAARWDPRSAATRQAAVETGDLDADLLPVFVEEAADYLPQIGENLRRWLQAPADRSVQQMLMRQLHTVKGSARMAGAMDLGQRVHDMETRIEAASVLSMVPVPLIEELIADHDDVVDMFESIRQVANGEVPAPAAAGTAAPSGSTAAAATVAGAAGTATAATDEIAEDAAAEADAVAVAESQSRLATPSSAPLPLASMTQPPGAATQTQPTQAQPQSQPTQPAPSPAQPSAQALVRVRADLLERVVNESGEVAISRSRLDNELGQLRQSLQDLTENVTRLRSQLREIEIQAESQIQARIAHQKETSVEFDPLEFDRYTRFQELTRMLAESVNDVATVQQNSMRSLDAAAQDMGRQSQVLRDLQQNLMRMRMVQFGSISDRLYRVVRQAAKELGKRVSLDIRGASVEIDRGVLERMAAPIEHLLRNACAHGIEPPQTRVAAGKTEAGEIRVEVRQEGNDVVLIFSDDGQGLNYARILERARAGGLIDEQAQPDERVLAQMIFAPGFSTAGEVTELSGRGVGMDVVRSEVSSLGGRIDVDSAVGAGTRFVVHLPLTLAIAQVVLVSAGPLRYAIPSSSVEQILQFKPQTLAAAYDEGSIEWQGTRVPAHYLGALVGIDEQPVAQHLSPIVLIRSGNLRLALHVDSVTRNQEVVVKNVGPQVARVPGIGGATVLGNGDIVLILNPARLAQAVLGDLWVERPASAVRQTRLAEVPPAVMVVDDSLTVRKATQRLLVREGYDVILAKDGVDAMRQLQDRVPDVMLVDIEMPRMDGFDLTRNVRADAKLRRTPIVMITSRTADKHRTYALSLGVDVYLGKPYRDDELLGHVARLTGGPSSPDVRPAGRSLRPA